MRNFHQVECDLMGLSGSAELLVPANGSAEYELNVKIIKMIIIIMMMTKN